MATTFSPGTVVNARNRLWRVDQQLGDVVTATAIDSNGALERSFYLPMESVALSELPPPKDDTVGTYQAQQLLLRAHRLSMLHGTAPLLSLQRSRVIPKDYQLVPVVMALEMPRVRMLIADDVGLGKTIEAGLVLTELMARRRASRVLVVVPAALREQWREALEYFFHLPARIISTRHRREMDRELPAGANPWEHFPLLITSIDYAKQPSVKNQILEQRWDAVLVDEAHLASRPHHSSPDQKATTDRWELAQALSVSEHVRHLLLLTATPHDGYSDTFASLLELLDVEAVSGATHEPVIHRDVAAKHVVQRRRSDVEHWFAEDAERSPFPKRDQQEVIIPPTSYERDAVDAVEAYGEKILEQATEGKAQHRTLAGWTVLHLHKRALSSPEALRCSLRNRRKSLRDRLENRLEEEDAGITEDVARASVLDEDTGERLDDELAARRTERVTYGSAEEIRAEIAHLEEALEAAEKVTPSRDSKLRELLRTVLRTRLQFDPKVIIFTRFVDTMQYLHDQIASNAAYEDTDVYTIEGGMSEQKRREVFQAFDRSKKAVLVATDAISEGINLQHAAAQVIHYELPWNPNRLEQRNGRVDRFGQQRPTVAIRTMVMDETLDAAIMKVLVRKAAQIREDYGFSPPYFGEETDILELLQQHEITVGPKQLGLFEQGGASGEMPEDPFAEDRLERIKGDSFYGQTHIRLPDVEERLEHTEQTIGSPEEIRSFVISGLNRFGARITDNKDGTFRVGVGDARLQTRSVPRVIERATFDPQVGLDDPDVTVLDLGHALVRRLIDVVKQETFDDDPQHYGRTAYVVAEGVSQVTAVVHLLARYAVQTDPVSVVEELVPCAIPVYGGPPLGEEQAGELLSARTAAQTRQAFEVEEAMEALYRRDDLDALLGRAVDARRQALVQERQRLVQQFSTGTGASGNGTLPDWVQGLDDLTPGSRDVLTLTIYFPA